MNHRAEASRLSFIEDKYHDPYRATTRTQAQSPSRNAFRRKNEMNPEDITHENGASAFHTAQPSSTDRSAPSHISLKEH